MKWDIAIIETDMSGVTLQSANGDTQWITWNQFEELRKNRSDVDWGEYED